ncbi:nucleotide sugar dehydrogenase [Natrononativus amylolyticus]|uniref:nucleotide sugar dehydrogenase n=1 Tax=Natrononativus amylolyticus TaxID=2963434 RepID=UPI0020CF3754|nr:nucleotide sugar dehydrogenase [Natrononativus amylolyticus]
MSDAMRDALSEGEREESATDTVCVVGMGYVGLPLAVAFDRRGADVIGLDVDESKIDTLASGVDATNEIGDETIADGEIEYTTDAAAVADAGYVIVTVPTPVDDQHNPNMDYVEAAGRSIGAHVRPGTTVVLESTVYPGATRGILVPALEEESGLTVGEDIHVGYSPERLAPGTEHGLGEVVKIVSGESPEVRDDLVRLYEQVVDAGVYPAPSIEVAEAAKVFENVQRDINIALVNELSITCDHLDLNTAEVLEAAETKWNFHDGYRPGLVGGHCIPVDPHLLAHRSESEGYSPKLILQAREINEYMPKHAAELTIKGLNRCGNVIRDSRVLVLGLAYKPNVGDIRTSEVSGVIAELKEYGAEVVGYDPHADPHATTEAFDIPIADQLSFDGFDAIVLATGHDEFAAFDLEAIADALNDDPFLMDIAGLYDRDSATESGFAYDRL